MFCFWNGRGESRQNCLGLKIYALKANESFYSNVVWDENKYTLSKRPETEVRKTKSFGGKIYLGERYSAFKRFKVWSETSKSFGGKVVHKSLRFWMVSGFESKIYQVFWREKSCAVQQISPIEIQSICLISGWTLQNCRFFFSFSQPYIVKK